MKSSSATCTAYTPGALTTNTAWSTKYTKKKKSSRSSHSGRITNDKKRPPRQRMRNAAGWLYLSGKIKRLANPELHTLLKN